MGPQVAEFAPALQMGMSPRAKLLNRAMTSDRARDIGLPDNTPQKGRKQGMGD